MNPNGINSVFPFFKKLKDKAFGSSIQPPNRNSNGIQQIILGNKMSVIQSDTLGMTIIQYDDNSQNEHQLQILTPEQWVLILGNGNLKGYSFTKIYFSLLKGIPSYLRFKIWLFFCTQNSIKNFKVTTKSMSQIDESILNKIVDKNGYLQIDQFTTELYQKLLSFEPLEKQQVQIEKDVHRTYSKKIQYKWTDTLLKKILIALSNSGIEYSQGMNYILLNVIIYCLQSIGINNQSLASAINIHIQKDLFIIMREIVIRMDSVFGNNNIFKVIGQLQQKIAESVPEILFHIYKLGMDCFSMFSHYYFALLSYNNPPDELCKMMMDLFLLLIKSNSCYYCQNA